MWDVRKRSTVKPLHPERTRRPSGAPPLPGILSVSIRGTVRLSASALALGGLLHALPAQAIEISQGELQGSIDTTLSHGLTFRVGERDSDLVADVNGNDGDLNYDRGLVSNTTKFTTDLDLGYRNFGAFVRATGFIDFENENGMRARTPLSDEAKDRVGKDLEVLDAYVTGTFDAGDAIVDLRLGKHVLNWGESTFIQNGINAINPFDVSKLRLPGSELREALAPVSMASLSVAPSDALSVEGFYQLDWEETEIDPVGSYFSTTDYVGAGAKRVEIDLTSHPLLGPIAPPPDDLDDSLFVDRGPDRNPRDSGQWGMALRYLAEDLNHTEFGFYFVNYHSRLPVVGVHAGTLDSVLDLSTGRPSLCVLTTTPRFIHPVLRPTPGIAGTFANIDCYAKSGHYFVEYPENIQLFGGSFNTQLGASGWALQGEYSYRRDAPQQIAERELLERGLEPLFTGSGFDEDIPGYVERNVSQMQATATKVLGPTLGADSLAFVTEVALMHVHGMPDKNETPLESPAGGSLSTTDADADATSFGYRMAARLDYNNAIGAVNLFPYVQFQHDVNGNSPSPSGPFVEGRTALTLGVRADYLSRWQAGLGYTRYAGRGNEVSDRDFVSASVKYSF